MKGHRTLQDKAELALKQAVREVVEDHRNPVRPLKVWKKSIETMNTSKQERIFKKGKEYIISKYSANRYFVAIVDKTGNIVPVFPFDSRKEARVFVDNYKK